MFKNKQQLKMTIALFLLFCTSLFSQENPCKLHLENVSIKSDYLDRLEPEFISFLRRSHLGYVLSIKELPKEGSEFTILIERPLFKNGFLGLKKKKQTK